MDTHGNGNSSSAVKVYCLSTAHLMSFKLNSGKFTTIETALYLSEGEGSKLELNEIKQLGTHIKNEAIPAQVWTVPEVSRRLRLPHFRTEAREGGMVFRRKHRPRLPLRKYSCCSFQLEHMSTPGHNVTGRIS